MATLDELLGNLPNYDLVTSAMKQAALDGAQVPDSQGRWPGEDNYVPTYDVYFAAISLVAFLKAQPFVKSASSEGTSVSAQAPDWDSLLAYYRSQSPIVQSTGRQVLQRVPIPDVPHVRRTDMSGGWDYSGDIDTDIG